ncbi:hypothetical protein [Clostridium perfringens]|uniref:hypothetical protein n=1 Tax=Clostridium perfringens TaxID=1502 RepID=UPI003221FCAB
MTTIKRFTPDYKMHAARFEPFARETEHGELVKLSDYEALVSELASSRQINAQTLQVKLTMAETIKELTDRVNALAVENAGFKHALSVILEHVDVTDKGQAGVVAMIANDELFNSETPATDAALAAIHAQGVEKFADMCREKSKLATTADSCAGWKNCSVHASSFAIRLREAK